MDVVMEDVDVDVDRELDRLAELVRDGEARITVRETPAGGDEY
jgi:hypothetical protein